MKDIVAGKVLCVLAPALVGLAHVSMQYGLAPCPVVGAIAMGTGIAELVVSISHNRKELESPIGRAYLELAVLGILGGAFYASIIGPLIVYFPQI